MGLGPGHRSRGVPRPAVPRWKAAQRSLAVVRLLQHCCGHSRGNLASTLARSILQLPLQNPLGLEGLPNVYRMAEAFMYALVVVGAFSMLLRLPRVGWIARQQIKWFAYTTAVAISGIILKNTVYPVVGVTLVWWAGFVITAVGSPTPWTTAL
jgi:hypothetical protein